MIDKYNYFIHTSCMLDINLIRTQTSWVREQLLKRGADIDFTTLLKMDTDKRKLQTANDELKNKRNTVTAEIARIKKSGANADKLITEMKKIGDTIAKNDATIADLEQRIYDFMSAVPNIPSADSIAGGKENNRVLKTFGKMPTFNFTPKNHVDLCVGLGLIDYERAAKISGKNTWVYTGAGAILEWALLNYFIDFHITNGYKFLMLPHLLNYQSGVVAGQFPKFTDDVFITNYHADIRQSKFLLPTAETALINMHRDEIVDANVLPIKYAGFTPCYRKEAGNYRTEERGMIRGFQFNKVEMFVFCTPEDTPKYFAELTKYAEKLVEGLGLHYQTVALAAGDCSSAMAKTYDVEVFIPSMNVYKEVSSISACNDYQARRGNIRYRSQATPGAGDKNKPQFLHTLNASGLATSRLIPAIVEQFQQSDGSVAIPKVLHKYMHGMTVLRPDKDKQAQ